MPQLIIIGVVLVGGWFAWKALKREMARVDNELESVRKRPTETLVEDPKTGKYRLKDKG
jgi:3-mercaptopyruvate sulfurtransferase SseA